MVKGGEYDFAILVTCLLILALQIHNPFQSSSQSVCHCGDSQSGTTQSHLRDASVSPAQRPTVPSAGNAQAAPGRTPPEPAPPVSRRPQVQQPVARPGGLSTDELLRELDSIQEKAKEQQDTLAAAGRMPPPSPILEQLREVEGSTRGSSIPGQMPARAMPDMVPPSSPLAGGAMGGGPMGGVPMQGTAPSGPPMGSDAPMLRSRADFGRFLEARQPRGLGVVFGVGRGDFALRLLADWGSAQGLYLVDPFIHIWRGYDDPSNLSDREHQVIFEDLRNRLAPFEGRHVLVRDFSHSFAEVYQRGGQTGQTPGAATFVYVDANHAEQAISRDLELWFPLIAAGGVMAGSTYVDDAEGRVRVKTAVDRFASRNGLKVYLTHDDMPPSWFIFKS